MIQKCTFFCKTGTQNSLMPYVPTIPIFLQKRKSIFIPEKLFEISLSLKLTNKDWVLTIKIFRCELDLIGIQIISLSACACFNFYKYSTHFLKVVYGYSVLLLNVSYWNSICKINGSLTEKHKIIPTHFNGRKFLKVYFNIFMLL